MTTLSSCYRIVDKERIADGSLTAEEVAMFAPESYNTFTVTKVENADRKNYDVTIKFIWKNKVDTVDVSISGNVRNSVSYTVEKSAYQLLAVWYLHSSKVLINFNLG